MLSSIILSMVMSTSPTPSMDVNSLDTNVISDSRGTRRFIVNTASDSRGTRRFIVNADNSIQEQKASDSRGTRRF